MRNRKDITPEPIDKEAERDELKEAIKKEILDSLNNPQHENRCAREDCEICRPDHRSDIEKISTRMGFLRGTWPMDLEEILTVNSGKNIKELLELSPDELASIFDEATSSEMPTGIIRSSSAMRGGPGESGQVLVKELSSTDETRTVKRWRPLTPVESAKRLKDQADKAKMLDDAKRALAAERRIDKARKELDDALRIVV